GERRLADSLRSADQPRMRDAPAAISGQQRGLRVAMAEQPAGLARMRNGGFALGLTRAHAGLTDACCGRVRARSTFQMRAAAVPGSALASISAQRAVSSVAILR